MSSRNHDDRAVSFAVPDEADEWLADEAARRGESRDEICRRLVTAAAAVATDDDLELADRDELAAVRGQLATHREEFEAHLDDVRERVIQVKREADAKAPADHDHAGYPTDGDLAAVRADLETLGETVDRGFENFETVLEDLLGDVDDLAERSTLLAAAVVDLRERDDDRADRRRRRAVTDDLKLAANRLGVRAATCEDCGSSVDIALLTAPECPHCGNAVTDVAERASIFGSHRLLTGDPPALEGSSAESGGPDSDALRGIADEDAKSTVELTDSRAETFDDDSDSDTGGESDD
ncbi:hypothetical protein [Natrinema saccharevitans]|uniref:hypothetical protein n=1 Tax=Natrinema saccharevitans TaxID=301967 RepID=UPI00096EE01A|nr:hypothetical protein [Natrinema saccharevitans]